ncbi:3'-5' RNA helicase ythdc2 [Chamberlinius hualienensis]
MTRSKNKNIGAIGEEIKIAVTLSLKKFILEDVKELEFPSSFTSVERAFIHSLARNLGLKSKSRGKSANRFLTVYKKDGSTIVQADAIFNLSKNSRQQIITLLQRYPVTNKERQDLAPLLERDRMLVEDVRDVGKATGRLNNGIPQVPPSRGYSEFSNFSSTLPIAHLKEEIVSVIDQHQVVLIAGETGSGKTTQVPQFILDSCSFKKKPCRIICTQPRRIAAVTIADRIALERDEKVGQTVGYQIRLESKVSPKTLLTFCTNGVLLRTLMGSDSALATVTHVVMDEIHERDRFSDFLLIILRDALSKFRNLKLILMSANLDLQLFLKYFNGCPVISVPGRLFEVQELFLEDILKCTGYMSLSMINYSKTTDQKRNQKKILKEWCANVKSCCNEWQACKVTDSSGHDYNDGENRNTSSTVAIGKANPDMDNLLMLAFLKGSDEDFDIILNTIMSDIALVDYAHSETGVTALIVAAARGCVVTVEQLISLGANVNCRSSNDLTALEWARNLNHNDVAEIIEAQMYSSDSCVSNMSELLNKVEGVEVDEETKHLLDIYHSTFDDENVDVDLIMTLLYKIIQYSEEGAILVFLPGYDEIVTIRDRILTEDKRFSDTSKYALFIMHSNMHSFDQKKGFKPAAPGVRKIILSTNIAETSVTVQDVVFVINSGKIREKAFDALSNTSSLRSVWISKSSAMQRKGRAGRCRPGICYHLFSRIRLKNMQEFQQPEILRVPIQDLCLQTKLLACPNTPIADYLARAPDPPPFMVTRNAVQLLKTIDALDPWECLTDLGHHLLDLPIDPRLGKMILYSVVLKCLDPILTIACMLAYKDPFTVPIHAADKKTISLIKKKYAAGTFSDHMTLLRVFQSWQKAGIDGWEKTFCQKHFVSSSTMEMIFGMRTQLLGQLRASGFVRARGGGDIRDLNTNSENWAVVKAALVAGTYPNLIRVDRERMQLITQKESKVRFHPSSVLSQMPESRKQTVSKVHASVIENLPADWLIYEELSRSEYWGLARCCTLVSPITVALFAGPSRLPLDALSETDVGLPGDGFQESNSDSEFEDQSEEQKAMFKIDDWVSFKIDSEAAHLALQLHQKWHSLFLRRIRAPGKPWSQVDESVIRCIIAILSNEEQALGLQQPIGVGQRPRPLTNDYATSMPATMRRCSADTENSDDSSSIGAESLPFVSRSHQKSAFHRKESFGAKGTDERSDSSSVKSTGSGSAAEVSSPVSPCSPIYSVLGKTDGTADNLMTARPITGKYFVVKAANQKVIDTSFSKSIWIFSNSNERKIQRCIQDGRTVFLIFSVQGSGHFQGYAKLTSEASHERVPEFSMPNSGTAYKLEWIKRGNIPFQSTRHLQNPWNENRKVHISRDGQELEPSVGANLCRLWSKMPSFTKSTKLGFTSNTKVSDVSAVTENTIGGDCKWFPNSFDQCSSSGRPIRGNYLQHSLDCSVKRLDN